MNNYFYNKNKKEYTKTTFFPPILIHPTPSEKAT